MKIRKVFKIMGISIAALLLLLGILFFILISKGCSITIGHCLIADNGSYLLVDENSPIVMSSKSESMFSNLSTGDKIFVIHSGVETSYPAQTGVYFCLKLGSGDISDISEDVIHKLIELGWLYYVIE